jgi:predicted ABC-type ATPase
MFAGPNGSGKTTVYYKLRKRYPLHWGPYQNPDEVERQLREDGCADLVALGLNVKESSLLAFIKRHELFSRLPPISPRIQDAKLIVPAELLNGYFAAVLCDFVRQEWLKLRTSFTFETVMSHPSKVETLREARSIGYRTYLYFVCTGTSDINQRRVEARVKDGGHTVPPEKIRRRYVDSLTLLSSAIQNSDRAFLFDNSREKTRFVAEFDNARLIRVIKHPPAWCVEYALRTP